ncbi:MAG TPA: glycosyltransferase family 1 protein [Patescibacteria group bacterium]|nr:glycosyltransferase family 1 protein [Patescibacteria group bacterium]
MKIGIDCRQFYDYHLNVGAGIERYSYHLVRNLLKHDQENEYVLFFYSDISPETIKKVKGKNSRVKVIKTLRQGSKIPFWDSHIKFSWIMKKEKLDLAIFPANIVPLFYFGRSILVIHDLAIFLYPEWFPDKQWFSKKILVPAGLRRADKIITVSNSTKNDLLKLFNVDEKKIKMIYPGVVIKDKYLDKEFDKIRQKYDIKNEYALFVGTIEPRKNILNLIKAFSNYIFENEESRLILVLAGIKGWKHKKIFKYLNKINKRIFGSRIKYIGKISNRERNILIKNCQVFVFPSLYEGFGFPVVEAMRLGAPVITSNKASLQEIGRDAAALINPADVNSIRKQIKKVCENKNFRQKLIVQGHKRADQLTWEKAITEFKALLK